MNILETGRSGDRNATRIRGDLLSKARREQNITMQWIRERGGPSPAYQCEVEHGTKTEVGSQVLGVWVRLLKVTEAFARGQVAQYHQDPVACRGLAAHVKERVVESGIPASVWAGMDPVVRARRILELVVQAPTPVPKAVLAHILGVRLEVVEGMLDGTLPIMPHTVKALSDITTLPDRFFRYGFIDSDRDTELLVKYGEALREADELGISADELGKWVRRHRRTL